jgi:Cu2+-exporting ATPase
MLLGGLAWDRALVIATAVLIITCPCALALAVPVVQVVASTRLLRAGVLLLSPTALERFAGVTDVVLDKTGTLTLGRPELVTGGGDVEALRMAAGLAGNSRHPLAQALVRAAPDIATAPDVPSMRQACGGRRPAGSARPEVADAVDDGLSELWLTRRGMPVRFAFADRLRPDAAAATRRSAPEPDHRGAVRRSPRRGGAGGGSRRHFALARRVTPAAKDQPRRTRRQGKRVLMVGVEQ